MNNQQNNLINKKTQWVYAFDLKIDNLKKYYGKSPSQAYKEIENYLYANRFNNRTEKQGSCYFTTNPQTYPTVNRIIRRMFRQLPWLPFCVSKSVIAEKPDARYDYMAHINKLIRTQKCKQALEDYQNKISNMVNPMDKKENVGTTKNIKKRKSR